jgi:hypothetical protein
MSSARNPQLKPRPMHDPGHAVEVLEKNTDTSWALFQALQQQQQRGFVETNRGGLAGHAPPAARAAAAEASVDDVLVEIRRNNRVCPLPQIWQRLFDYLPNKTPQLVPVPQNPQEWMQTPALQKRTALRTHVEWAASQGVLKQVYQALLALPEEKWHHMGE